MDLDSDITSPSKRVSNRASIVSPVEDKRKSAITNEKKADEYDSSGNEPSETNGINKPVRKSKNLSEESFITKDENNQQTTDLLQQETIPTEENFEHNEGKSSTELKKSNEIQEAEAELNDIVIHDEGRQKSEGCCGCFVEVCYCVTWYWRIMTNSIVSCFRSCGSSLSNLCRKCGKSPNRANEDSDGNYFYNGLSDTFNNEVDRDACGNIIEVNEAPNILTNDCSVPDGNDGGYDNCGVDASVYDKCGADGGVNDNCGIERGGNDRCGVDVGGNDNSAVEGGGDQGASCDS